MRHKFAHKQPRFHPGLEWESRNLSNEFVDINRMALDDRYGKNAAPLSKRRNGIGFTDGNTPGLFGLGSTKQFGGIQQSIQDAVRDPKKAYIIGGLVAVGAYTIIDWATHKPNRTKFQRMIRRTPGSLIIGAVALSIFAPSA